MSHNFFTDLYYSVFPNSNKYLTYSTGKSNIILSAPHGGNIKPINIPYRKYGNRSRDTYTRTLIQKVVKLLNKEPYYVYSDIHRSRVDLNRDFDEATQGNKYAEKIWKNWNAILGNYLTEVRYFYKKGLYIDIHSHNNGNEFQIGYGLNVRDYIILLDDKPIPTSNSTMHELKEFSLDKYKSEHSVLFGPKSIPYSLERFGYKVLLPKNDKNFLNGGRNIKTFNGKGIGAMQIECPIPVLKKEVDKVALVLVKAIEIFSKEFLVDN